MIFVDPDLLNTEGNIFKELIELIKNASSCFLYVPIPSRIPNQAVALGKSKPI